MQALLPLSFLFICTLEWCKHCSRLEVAANFHKLSFTEQCGIDAERVVSWPVHDCTLFPPTQGFYFQVLLPLSFLCICTFHWCKHCTGLDGAPNFLKFQLTALWRVHAEVLCMPVPDDTPFAPTQGIHFQALLLLSFIFICTLHWCKRYSGLEVAPNFPQISIDGVMWN